MATLGIDIGCISVKIAVVGTPEDRDLFKELASSSPLFYVPEADERVFPAESAPPVLATAYRRIKGSPSGATRELLAQVLEALPDGLVAGVRVTGSGGKLICQLLDVPYENEFKAIARASGELHPDISTVFEMGGESSKFIQLEIDEATGRVGIADYGTNGDCAAGTGSFMDQQANRLLYDIEDVGDIVRGAGKAASIAGRCSVFAKSDMIHAQQKGYQPPEVLKGLCNAVVRNYRGTITKGKEVTGKVAFIGGVAANKGAVGALREAFGMDEDRLVIPAYYAWMGAIGSALLEADEAAVRAEQKASGQTASLDLASLEGGPASAFQTSDALSMDRVILLRDRVKPYQFPADEQIDAYLGVDVGSVSTNLVVLDTAGEVVKEIYVKTDGRPVEVVNKGLSDIWEEMGPRLRILGVGTTGSGRELIGELIGADTVNDEITAHKTGATFIGRKLIDRVPDTIFEIGGQDSKYISLEDGVVVDFAMNEACAAGTGSFLEEQAEKLDINIIGEFAELALSSEAPVRLGERCTVFMERDVNSLRAARRSQEGPRRRTRILHRHQLPQPSRRPTVRRRHHLFPGRHRLQRLRGGRVQHDPGQGHHRPPAQRRGGCNRIRLTGTREDGRDPSAIAFPRMGSDQVDYTMREFTCKGCSNECDIRQFTIGEEKTYWGDKCSDRYRKRAKVDREPIIRDLLAFRESLMFSFVSEADDYSGVQRSGTGAPRGTMGIPRAMYTFDRLPFWATFFRGCGFDVMVSRQTDKKIREAGVEYSVAEPCFPIRVAHGHVAELFEEGADFVFVPNQLNEETDHPELESHACPWGQTLPHVIGFAPHFQRYRERILAPTLHFRRGPDDIRDALRPAMKRFGVPEKTVDEALKEAYAAQGDFRARLVVAGADALATLAEHDELGIVLVGRPYNIYDSGVNMDIPAKLRRYYGVNIIPLDFLPIWRVETRDITANMFWNYGRKILQAAKVVARYPNLHIIYMTNFKCGPDSYVKHFIRPAAHDPFLILQFDEHTNDAGAMTRCEAYLDSKGFLRWWARGEHVPKETVREG